MTRIAALFDGPLDLIGDVHGEIDALRDLLYRLGYGPDGTHPEGRRLVFVGDLCDRGPDSPAVLDLVSGLMESGHAQCVLGNHELNILCGAIREGNGWFFEHDHDRAEGKFHTSAAVDPTMRSRYLAFLEALPLALEGPGLRVVHACWHADSVGRVWAASVTGTTAMFDQWEEELEAKLEADGAFVGARDERLAFGELMHDPNALMPMLPNTAVLDETRQMANPIRVLTSGVERVGTAPFYSSGKWRMVERVAWWNEYAEDVPVVIGHYWRWPYPVDRAALGKGGPDLFGGASFDEPLGARKNVYCIDYSVGRRFQERLRGTDFQTRLGALRWPEREVVFDDLPTAGVAGSVARRG
ncbi:metallophosphoesterase [Luteibacter sp. 9133]|uniref:metallophosphoesterase n=1 Tax=Luteibacter sp. 9133 TaxID=1500891 RepID=UPI000691E3EE|nr:metallophosphoesterase [Luteibacter sp. 9133]